MKRIVFVLFAIVLSFNIFAQSTYFQGFNKVLQGKSFTYHSAVPEITSSLLVRGQAEL